jgi:hypothetical protein|tara:strand:- start:264 stop:503 length:240 start_codon:yes stop_codon:yes gene_type:complete
MVSREKTAFGKKCNLDGRRFVINGLCTVKNTKRDLFPGALSALRRTKSEAIMAVSPAPGEGWQSANGAPFYCIFFQTRP